MICDWWIWIRFVFFCVSKFVACDLNIIMIDGSEKRNNCILHCHYCENFRVCVFEITVTLSNICTPAINTIFLNPSGTPTNTSSWLYSLLKRIHSKIIFLSSCFLIFRNFLQVWLVIYHGTGWKSSTIILGFPGSSVWHSWGNLCYFR